MITVPCSGPDTQGMHVGIFICATWYGEVICAMQHGEESQTVGLDEAMMQ